MDLLTRDLSEVLGPINSIVVAEFDRHGRLRHGNIGLRRITAEVPLSLWQLITQPSPDSLLTSPPDESGRIYSGLLTARGQNDTMISLTGTVYQKAGRILLIAGYDMDEFDRLESSLLRLNEEINNAYRELARSNRELEARELEIRELSFTDALTGVGNRRRLDELLLTEVDRAVRYSQPLSLVMLDIDHFKRVNDEWGHETGDRVLRQTGAALRTMSRQSDIATRMGGEEFVVLLPATDLSDAVVCAERFRGVMEASDFGLSAPVTSSFGVACLRQDESGAALLARADEALYEAKQQGRNRVVAAREMAGVGASSKDDVLTAGGHASA